MSNYRKKILSCFDIGEVPKSPEKWNWNQINFLQFIFIFIFQQCVGKLANHNGIRSILKVIAVSAIHVGKGSKALDKTKR